MNSLGYTVADAWTLTRRNLIRYVRIPTLVVFSTIQPIMFLLLFSQVFGGAIHAPGNFSYTDYLMPGIFGQTVVFGSMGTGIALAEDQGKGMIDRFKSLPMSRSAVLAGRTIAEVLRNIFVVILMVMVGYAIGFRFHNGVTNALIALGVVVLFGFAFSWISATIGLVLRDVETVQSAGFIWLFPLVFASSVFVPVQTMPGWLQSFTNVNPISTMVDALRALILGGSNAFTPTWQAIAWAAGICAVFIPLAVSRYRKVA